MLSPAVGGLSDVLKKINMFYVQYDKKAPVDILRVSISEKHTMLSHLESFLQNGSSLHFSLSEKMKKFTKKEAFHCDQDLDCP